MHYYGGINIKDVIRLSLYMRTRMKDEFLKFLNYRVSNNIGENHVFLKNNEILWLGNIIKGNIVEDLKRDWRKMRILNTMGFVGERGICCIWVRVL
jgi:hypothetical protein